MAGDNSEFIETHLFLPSPTSLRINNRKRGLFLHSPSFNLLKPNYMYNPKHLVEYADGTFAYISDYDLIRLKQDNIPFTVLK